MKFHAGNLFLGLSVFLLYIELIRSAPVRAEHTKLLIMFPQSNAIHFPPIEKISNECAQSYPNFNILNGRPMYKPAPDYLKRGRFIFGWAAGDNIGSLGHLFREQNLFPVFDTENHKWYTLAYGELLKLGVSRSLKLVRGIDEVHAEFHARNHQANPKAHDAASEAAYLKTRDYEGTLRKTVMSCGLVNDDFAIKETDFTPQAGVKLVKEYYEQEYNKAYQNHAGESSGGR